MSNEHGATPVKPLEVGDRVNWLRNALPVHGRPRRAEIELRGDTTPPDLTHWFDICPIGTKTEALVEGIAHSGYSSRPHSLLSPEHARDFIQKQAAANGAIARAAAEIANAAPTPHGIERWFIAPKESA